MRYRLALYKYEGCRSYVLEDSEAACPVPDGLEQLCSALEARGKVLVAFGLPDDVVPRLAGERRMRRGKYRVAPLTSCYTHFSAIWERTNDFEDWFCIYVFDVTREWDSGMQDIVRYLRGLPWRWWMNNYKVVDHSISFLKKMNTPALIMQKWDDGTLVMLSSSPEFLDLVKSTMCLLRVETKVDEPHLAVSS